MKTNFYCLLIGCIIFYACQSQTHSPRQMVCEPDFAIYSDEDSLVNANIGTFVKEHDKTMFVLYNADCSACIVGVSLWLNFAKKYPEVTPVFAVYTAQSPRAFWLQTYTYYTPPIYVFFDKEFKFFQANQIVSEHDTFIVDSTGKVVVEGNIHDKKFEKQYLKYKKQQRKK